MKAVLFDLDGTLLQVDMYKDFLPAYLKLLGGFIADRYAPDKFVKQLLASTDAMVRNDGKGTNEEVFAEHFFNGIGGDREEWMPVFDRFYEQEFIRLKPLTKPEPGARRAVEAAFERGCKTAVATNPVFPRAAMNHRIHWAGLNDLPFSLVTSYEDMHYCKPNPAYYLEVLEHMGCRPDEALMVGNDVEEDLAAAKVGLKTFLVVNDFTVQRAAQRETEADFEGTLADLARMLKNGEI